MGSPGRGFRVDPEQLTRLADDIHQLMREVSGDAGYVAGNLPEFQQKASDEALRQGLAGFWQGGDDVFSDAYRREHDGICQTYSTIAANLQQLELACRTTAASYHKADTDTRTAVTSSDGAW